MSTMQWRPEKRYVIWEIEGGLFIEPTTWGAPIFKGGGYREESEAVAALEKSGLLRPVVILTHIEMFPYYPEG